MTRWDIDKAEGYMWVAVEPAAALCATMKKETGICFTQNLVYLKNHQFKWCLLSSEMKSVGNFLIKRFMDEKFRQRFVKRYKNFYKNTVKELNRIDKIDLSVLDEKKLFFLLEKANGLYVKNFDFSFIMEPMDLVMPGLLNKNLKKYGYTTNEISDLLVIVDTSFLNKEEQQLISIAKKTKKSQSRLLKVHAYTYRWLQSDHGGRKDLALSYFKKRMNELKKIGLDKELLRLKNFSKESNSCKNILLKQKKIDHYTKSLLRVSEMVGPLHDVRKELFLRSIYTFDTLREEFSKRYGYTKYETSWFSTDDYKKMMNGWRPNHEECKKISDHCLLYINTKKNIKKLLIGEEAERFANKELQIKNIQNLKTIIGMCASPGKAKGRVTIINGVKSMHKMKKGDILVSSMTKQEFVVAIKKAAAIVTDEGGVTCHASIISRELGIPCVIGTRIATHILKDGDIIEVDADFGTVKIIKKIKD